jgi:hypothetical protein
MRAYVLVDDSDDEQATAPHDTGTGELRTLGFRAAMTDTARRGISHRRRSRFASFPPFSRNGWFTVLREGLLVPLEKIPYPFVSHTSHTHSGTVT